MTSRGLIVVGASALVFSLSVATLATAAPIPPQDAFNYRVSPPPANPHDVFRHNIKVPAPEAKTAMAMKDCDCPMMRAAVSKPGHGG